MCGEWAKCLCLFNRLSRENDIHRRSIERVQWGARSIDRERETEKQREREKVSMSLVPFWQLFFLLCLRGRTECKRNFFIDLLPHQLFWIARDNCRYLFFELLLIHGRLEVRTEFLFLCQWRNRCWWHKKVQLDIGGIHLATVQVFNMIDERKGR